MQSDWRPLEWHEATALAQAGAPYVGEVLDRAFAEVQGVVVLLTGDDLAHLRMDFVNADDGPHETTPTPQARPNVLFEPGMAFGRHPESTILVTLGYTRPFSDVAGRHTIKISNALAHRQVLAARLKTIGCAVVTETRTGWHEAGDFDAAVPKLRDSAASNETGVQEHAVALRNENQALRDEIRQINTKLAESVDAEPCPRCRRKGWHVESSEPDPEFGELGGVRRLYRCEFCGFTESQLKTAK